MVSQIKINLNLISYEFQKKVFIKIFKSFLHEKDRLRDGEERRKDTMEEKEPEKENSYFHMTTNVDECMN